MDHMWNQGHTFHSPCLIWCVNPASASYSVAENCISVPLWKSESDWRHFHAVRTPQAERLEGNTHCSSWDNNQLAAFRCHDKKQFLSQAGNFFFLLRREWADVCIVLTFSHLGRTASEHFTSAINPANYGLINTPWLSKPWLGCHYMLWNFEKEGNSWRKVLRKIL